MSCFLGELILLIPSMLLKIAGHTVSSEANVNCLLNVTLFLNNVCA